MKIEIYYSFGYVFDKSKLIVMYPVGSNTMEYEDYEVEVEALFLKDGIEKAFEKEDIDLANENIKPLETFLTKPNKVIPFVTSIKNTETNEEIIKLLEEFDEEYELKDYYINKGYLFKNLLEVCENIKDFIPKENIENLNILKINKDEFDLEGFIKNSKDSLNVNNIHIKMKKSDLTDRLYIEGNESEYVVFARLENKSIICANNKTYDINVDKGDLEINENRDFGYVIDFYEDFMTFKVANFNYKTSNNNKIAQVVDYSGLFKKEMIDYLDNFKK